MAALSENKNMMDTKIGENDVATEEVMSAEEIWPGEPVSEEQVSEKDGTEEDACEEEEPEKDMTGRTVTGTVRWFSARRGYGFITQDGTGKDFYVHYSEIVGTGFRKLTSGEAVEFEVGKDQDDRPVATNVVQLAGFTAIDDPKGGQYGL